MPFAKDQAHVSAARPPEDLGPGLEVRAPDERDRLWAENLWRERWGGLEMVVHDEVFSVREMNALIAWREGVQAGLVTYRVHGSVCEILSLDSLQPNGGVGTALLAAVVQRAQASNCDCLRVTTTNDNLSALRFYQKRGFVLRRLSPGGVIRARQKKPQIPLLGAGGIAVRDEIELERSFRDP